MAYWWVNHKQTYRQETDGGYIWSPKANANGARNVSYDNLTRCQRGGCGVQLCEWAH
jgi:putative restriction endonuclease